MTDDKGCRLQVKLSTHAEQRPGGLWSKASAWVIFCHSKGIPVDHVDFSFALRLLWDMLSQVGENSGGEMIVGTVDDVTSKVDCVDSIPNLSREILERGVSSVCCGL